MSDASTLERTVRGGGLAVFPTDTVYGIGCDPLNEFAVERLYLLKRRERFKPCAVMFFDLALAFEALPELGERTRVALSALMPGAVSVLLPNPRRRFPLACGVDPSTLGLRVIPGDARVAVLQSSANRAGRADPRRLADVPELIRAACDAVIDGGELPGTASTYVDLRGYEEQGSWSVVRQGAVSEAEVAAALGGQFHFDPNTYAAMIRDEVPAYERLQDQLLAASGERARRILELGTGTGETARRLLAQHPGSRLIGIDASGPMLAVARAALPGDRAQLSVSRLEDPLPQGSFDLVASALAVHHLGDREKADLFKRVREVLEPGGLFVLADVVVPDDDTDAITPLTPGFDRPSTVADQLRWLSEAGFRASVRWQHRDLAVIVAEAVYRRP